MMRKTILALVLLASSAPLAADIGNPGGANRVLYYCRYQADGASLTTEWDEAVRVRSEDRGIYNNPTGLLDSLALLVLRDAVQVTTGPGSSTWCGTLEAGEAEWALTITVGASGPGDEWLAAIAPQIGFVDESPADGVDDTTGLSMSDYTDDALRRMLRRVILDAREPTPPADPGDWTGSE